MTDSKLASWLRLHSVIIQGCECVRGTGGGSSHACGGHTAALSAWGAQVPDVPVQQQHEWHPG